MIGQLFAGKYIIIPHAGGYVTGAGVHLYVCIGECYRTLYVRLSGIVRNLIQKSTG